MLRKNRAKTGDSLTDRSADRSGYTVSPRAPRSGAILARLALLALLAVATVAIAASPVLAQAPTGLADPTGNPPASARGGSEVPPAGQGPTDKKEVGAFMDGYFAQQLQSTKIPGATVSVVKDGKVLFAKGYGEADVAKGKPVVADETLFRVGSVSKLFTATAVMQLVEEGKLDLDEDVNRYLDDVRIPDTYPGRPVTLRHLLTHTAGFEQDFVGTGAHAADFQPLGEYLSEHVPARVKPPGEVTSYSNFGMSLAGHIVEEASGMTYAQHIEENITAPLGMDGTAAAQPPAPGLRDRLSTGYKIEGGEPAAGSFEHIEEAPAGAVSSTAADMARFMIAHLQDGRYGDARILEEDTAKEMHQKQFSNDPRLGSGQDFGFYQHILNGERVIEHGGNTDLFHSLVTLLPEKGVGIFVSYNSYGEGESGHLAEYEMQKAFMDHYYPEKTAPSAAPKPSGASGDTERVAGSYLNTRSNYTGFEKVFDLLGPASVKANADGSITTSGVLTQDFTATEHRWVEDGPMVFRAEGSDEHIAFRRDGEGNVSYLSTDVDPTSAYEKVPSYESPKLHLYLLAGGLVVFVLTALAWLAGALISRWYGRRYRKLHGEPGGEPKQNAGGARLARLVGWAFCALALLLVGGMALAATHTDILYYGDSPVLATVRALPFPIAALAVVVVACAALSWRRQYWGLFGRAHYSLLALAAVPFVALLGYYNLLGF